jgi:lipopolysaccharide/colanic/teichoic acid biosynthesis glycosyltransferase
MHLIPFSILFGVWLVIFFIAGLYDQHTTIFRARLPEKIFRVQLGNIALAAVFFFFVPIFGIAPKTNLVLYLIVSSVLIVLWRVALVPRFLRRKERQEALLVAGGAEFKELFEEVNDNARYPFYFSDSLRIDHANGGGLADLIFSKLKNERLAFVVVDQHHKRLEDILPHLYKPIFSNVQFIDARELYEEIFERVPLSIIDDPRFLEMLERPVSRWYEVVKRTVDIVGGLAMGAITFAVAPLIWMALRLEGPGSLFIVQQRIGMRDTRIRTYKFRSICENDAASASWVHEGENRITRVGALLRRISLDEFPQFMNILSGELSLIGPRNDIEGLAKRLEESIPFYHYRYLVKPGITGWAQINQRYEPGNISPQSVDETKVRLAYDFYYIKNRTVMLDFIIALKTLKRMVFRMSS